MSTVSTTKLIIPARAVIIPDFSGKREGRLLIKSQESRLKPLLKMLHNNKASTNSPKSVQNNPKYLNKVSMILFLVILHVAVSKTFFNTETDVVQNESEDEQG
jgi:hypothetical protein